MAAATGIWNHNVATGQALRNMSATPMAGTANGTSSSSSDSSTISANDFLTLLVTEMKNQDPTANTDPNEYINQLVQVNSLEQLIDINQNLSTALGGSSTSSSGSASSEATGSTSGVVGEGAKATAAQAGVAAHNKGNVLAAGQSAASAAAHAVSARQIRGNLSVPEARPAAHRVAHALDGQSRARSIAGGPSGAR